MNEPTAAAFLCFASPEECTVCKDAARIIKTKLDDIQCGFRRGRALQNKLPLSSEFFKKSWEDAKDVYTCIVDLGKIYGRVLRE